MDDESLRNVGRLLAERHSTVAEARPEQSLLNYDESSRAGDWSLRSALPPLAQPDPVRAAAVLHLVRRLDAALHPLTRSLEKHIVNCDRALDVQRAGHDALPDIVEASADARTTDLARMLRSVGDSFTAVLAGYAGVAELTEEEQLAIPLLVPALDFDDLAECLTDWASVGPEDPPIAAVDATCELVQGRLDELGVPEETRPTRPGR